MNSEVDQINKSLRKHILISHSDIDQKNVLWLKDDKPQIIDWESVGPTNPGLEIVDAAMTNNHLSHLPALSRRWIRLVRSSWLSVIG